MDFHARQECLKKLEHELSKTRDASLVFERRLENKSNIWNREATTADAEASLQKELRLESEIRDLIAQDPDAADTPARGGRRSSNALARYRDLKAQYETYEAYAAQEPTVIALDRLARSSPHEAQGARGKGGTGRG